MITRRELENQAAHSGAKESCDIAEIMDEDFGVFELFDMGDQFRDFDCIHEILISGLALPGAHRAESRPGIEWGVELDCAETFHIGLKPFLGRGGEFVENPAPMPIEPAGTAYVNFWEFVFDRLFVYRVNAKFVHFLGAQQVAAAFDFAAFLAFS